jgi:hypothetical protein
MCEILKSPGIQGSKMVVKSAPNIKEKRYGKAQNYKLL